MKNLILVTVLLILFSCNNRNNAQHKTGNDAVFKQVDNTDSSRKENVKILSRNYSEWSVFWREFKRAALKKDTANILGLVNFPFSQNAELMSAVEFKEICISQLDGIERAIEPVDAFGFPLQRRDQVAGIDSVRYANFNHIDFYFAKVNGFYKLVEIITPG